MLRISKKKLKFAKWLMWGGWTTAVVSIIAAVIFAKIQKFSLHVGARVCLFIALFSCIAMLYGLHKFCEMYVCPKCGTGVLMRGMRTYDFCYKCGTKIIVEISDSENL